MENDIQNNTNFVEKLNKYLIYFVAFSLSSSIFTTISIRNFLYKINETLWIMN